MLCPSDSWAHLVFMQASLLMVSELGSEHGRPSLTPARVCVVGKKKNGGRGGVINCLRWFCGGKKKGGGDQIFWKMAGEERVIFIAKFCVRFINFAYGIYRGIFSKDDNKFIAEIELVSPQTELCAIASSAC